MTLLLVTFDLDFDLFDLDFDLDRPPRGVIKVPSTALVGVRASMALPPAAGAPQSPQG
jgi:hypothetical protein